MPRFSVFLILVLALFTPTTSPSLGATPKLPERWEKEIAAFEAEDRANAPPSGGILFVGSSSIRLWTNLAETFPEWKVVRRGFGGSYLSDVNAFFDRLVMPYKPKAIVVYAGDNDLADGQSPEQVFNEFKKLATSVKAKLPPTKVYYLAIKPSPSRWYLSPQISEANDAIKRYARSHANTIFVDVGTPLLKADGRPDPNLFQKDMLHLNSKGYELWALEIRKSVKP